MTPDNKDLLPAGAAYSLKVSGSIIRSQSLFQESLEYKSERVAPIKDLASLTGEGKERQWDQTVSKS